MTPANKGRKLPAEPLTPSEAQSLVDAIKGRGPIAVRNRALVALLWRSGLRCSEALALRPCDVDELQGTVRVREGKGRKDRVVVIDSLALGYVRAWTEVRGGLGVSGQRSLFCAVSGASAGKSVDSSYVRRLLPKLGALAGVSKRVHAHGLRHTMATEMVARGIPMNVISGQLGHASTATTDTYVGRLMPSERIRAMREAGWELAAEPGG